MLRHPEPADSDAEGRIVVRFQSDGTGVPDIVREVCEDRDWVEFDPSEHGPSDWNLWWKVGRFRAADFERLESWQRLNHHPQISASITSKDGLLREMRILQGTHGRSVIDFVPDTFVMPREERQFQRRFAENKEKKASNFWIFKPADLSRGRGIFVFNELTDLRYSEKSVVQQYISDPFLIGGYKFDLRLYAVVVSFKPLVVYICREGIARFGTERYDLKNLCNVYSHITNTSINVGAPSYDAKKASVGSGCKWSLGGLRHFLAGQGIDDAPVFAQIRAIIVLTLMAQARSVSSPAANCYELYGFDILLDARLKAWLLEVNFSPAMNIDCAADASVKREMLSSVFDLLCFSDADRLQSRAHGDAKSKRMSVDSGLGSARSLRRHKSGSSLSRAPTFSDSALAAIEEGQPTPASRRTSRESSSLSRNSSASALRLPPLPQEAEPPAPGQARRQVRENRTSLLRSRLNLRRQPPANQRPPRPPATQPIRQQQQRLRLLAQRDPHAMDAEEATDRQLAVDTGERQHRLSEQQRLQDTSPYGSCPITRRWRQPPRQFGSLHLAFPFSRATEAACLDVRAGERTIVREILRHLRCEAPLVRDIWPPVRQR